MNSLSSLKTLSLLLALTLCVFAHAQAAPTTQNLESEGGNQTEARPPVALDVVLERIDLEGKSEETVGARIVNEDKRQTIKLVMGPTQTQSFLAHIKNTGRNDSTFQVHLGGPRSAQGNNTVWKSKGWSCYATVNGDTKNILKELQSKEGWETPRLEPGGEAVLRLAVTTEAVSPQLEFDGSFRLTAQRGEAIDAVLGDVGVQFIRAVEWSTDGEKWTPVTGVLRLPALQGMGLRVVAANPKIEWDDFAEFLPKWRVQEPWEPEIRELLGEMIWLHAEAEGTINFMAIGNNEIKGQIVVTPEED